MITMPHCLVQSPDPSTFSVSSLAEKTVQIDDPSNPLSTVLLDPFTYLELRFVLIVTCFRVVHIHSMMRLLFTIVLLLFPSSIHADTRCVRVYGRVECATDRHRHDKVQITLMDKDGESIK